MPRFLTNRMLLLTASLFAVFVTHSIAQTYGSGPNGLTLDSAGNLYGSAGGGGANGDGTVFKLSSPTYAPTLLYSFQGTPDGSDPAAGVILDSAGNVYGTTYYGGTYNDGTVFEISSTGVESILYSFPGGADGANPSGGVIRDSAGNLYGTTYQGGAYSRGTVFKLSSTGSETVLYSFKGGTQQDGSSPNGGVIMDSKGNLYGTTNGGGPNGNGIVFEISPAGTETILYSFKGMPDGSGPNGGVVRDSAGNLYGTTAGGGTKNFGTVFEISPTGTETMLYSFPTYKDGDEPVAGVILDSKGNMYGTTEHGGADTDGNVFRLSPGGSEIEFTFTGANGEFPIASLTRDSEGNIYGTTEVGGRGYGNVFKISPKGVEMNLFNF